MDGGSWMLQAAAGDMYGSDNMIRCSWCDMATDLRHHEQEATMMISSQAMQQQLSHIYMLMDIEEHDQYATDVAPAPSPSSSSFRSFFAGKSRDDNSSLLLTAATSTTTDASHRHHHQQPEVSSQIPRPVQSPYGAGVDVPDQETAHRGQAALRRRGHGVAAAAAACAFQPYSRYLVPKKNLLRPGGTTVDGGQRAFKKTISVLSKIHTERLVQYYQIMEMAARPSPAATGRSDGDNDNQQQKLQHVLSERKRREKLNDSFKALRDVLPPATKDKTSVLMRAKDYVNVLKARIAELEEKNRRLAESQLHAGDSEQDNDRPDDKIEGNIGRSAADNGCSAMDSVAGILQDLNEKRDVSLLATGNSSDSGHLPREKSSQQPAIKLQLKSSS